MIWSHYLWIVKHVITKRRPLTSMRISMARLLSVMLCPYSVSHCTWCSATKDLTSFHLSCVRWWVTLDTFSPFPCFLGWQSWALTCVGLFSRYQNLFILISEGEHLISKYLINLRLGSETTNWRWGTRIWSQGLNLVQGYIPESRKDSLDSEIDF